MMMMMFLKMWPKFSFISFLDNTHTWLKFSSLSRKHEYVKVFNFCVDLLITLLRQTLWGCKCYTSAGPRCDFFFSQNPLEDSALPCLPFLQLTSLLLLCLVSLSELVRLDLGYFTWPLWGCTAVLWTKEWSGVYQSHSYSSSGTLNVCVYSHGNAFNSCWDISAWSKVVDGHCYP